MPADTDGPSKDLQVYENVFAVVETGGKHSQVQIGTLLRVGDVWRLIDAPAIVAEGQRRDRPGGLFLPGRGPQSPQRARPPAAQRPDAETPGRPGEARSVRSPAGADLLEQIAESAKTPEERTMWYRQLADTISAAVQSGKSPDGDKRLETLFHKLQKNEADKPLAAYVRFRQLMAQYTLSLQAPKADFAKIQAEWLKNARAVHRRLSHRARRRRGDAPVGHRPGVRRPGRRGQAVVRADRAGVCRLRPPAKKAAGAATRLDSRGQDAPPLGQEPLRRDGRPGEVPRQGGA